MRNEKSFDINLYTALVVLGSQTVDYNFIDKEDLYDFCELDNDLGTGIVDSVSPDVDLEEVYPDKYADLHIKWRTEAVIRYQKMRDEFLMGE